jgi:hypothetical protein
MAMLVTPALSSCATQKATTLRLLPTTLADDTIALLAGCDVGSDGENLAVTCPDGVAVNSFRAPAGLLPAFEGTANDIGRDREAPPRWSERTLLLDVGRVALREAHFTTADDVVVGVFLASVLPVSGEVQEVWCHGPPDATDRCELILTALLQGMADTGVQDESAPTRVATPRLLGRSLSLPTSCGVDKQDNTQGHYACGELAMTWHVASTMDDAAAEAEALLSSIPSDVTPTTVPCRLAYETSVCRATSQVIVGTAYIDGKAIFAACVHPHGIDVRTAPACRIFLGGTWDVDVTSP